VRLATRLVGWEIDIVSEELLKKEIAQQMGKMMASGEAVPITAIEGVTAAQAEDLKAKGVDSVEKLSAISVDDLVDTLDISLDEAEHIISAAKAVVEASRAEAAEEEETAGETDDLTGVDEASGEAEEAGESAAPTPDETEEGSEPKEASTEGPETAEEETAVESAEKQG
jgi:hypothetical protein